MEKVILRIKGKPVTITCLNGNSYLLDGKDRKTTGSAISSALLPNKEVKK